MKKPTALVVAIAAALLPLYNATAVVSNINGVTASTQFLIATTSDLNLGFEITSSSPGHLFRPIWSGILQPARGGTGASGFATGSVLFYRDGKVSEDNTNFFWDGVAGLLHAQNLTFSSSTGANLRITTFLQAPTSTIGSLTLNTPLPATSGGTGASTFAKGDLLVASGSSTLERLPKGQNGQVLMTSSTAPLGVAWVFLTPQGKHFQVDSSSTLTSGLIAYYPLESNSNDFWGTKHGTDVGTPSFSSSGRVGNAAQYLSSSTQRSDLPNSLLPWGTAQFSVSLWFKRNATTNNTYVLLGSQTTNSGNGGLFIDYGLSSAGKIGSDKVGYGGTPPGYTWTQDTNWHHLVVTNDGTNFYVYFDNSQVASETGGQATSTPIDSGNPVSLGARNGINTADSYFDGLIDEVGVWNRALTEAEIGDLNNGGAGQTMVQ
jgi:hypothetical protein